MVYVSTLSVGEFGGMLPQTYFLLSKPIRFYLWCILGGPRRGKSVSRGHAYNIARASSGGGGALGHVLNML